MKLCLASIYSESVFCKLIVMVLLFVSGPSLAFAQNTPFVAPLELDAVKFGCPLVRVSINGSRPLLFLLDTGDRSPLSLLAWTAKQLNISLPIDGSSVRLNKQLIKTCEIQGNNNTSFSLSVPYINFLPTSPIEGFGTEPVAGHIGLPALLGTRMTLDFATKELTLRTKAQAFTPKSDTTVFPLKAIDDPLRIEGVEVKLGMRRVSIATTIGVEAVKHPVNLIVDTGSDLTHVPRTVLISLEPYRIGDASTEITSLDPALQAVAVQKKMILLPSLLLGKLSIPFAALVENAHPLYLEVLGVDILSRYHTTFDFVDRKLYLEPNSTRSVLPPVKGRGEIGYGLRGGREREYVVDTVDAGALPEAFAAQHGDTVLSVDGVSAHSILTKSFLALVSGLARTTATIELEREGDDGKKTRHTVSYIRRPYYTMRAVVLPRQGLFVQYTLDALEVTSIEPNSPAVQAGIKAGDIIVSVNQKPTRTLDPVALEKETYVPEGTETVLEVRSKEENAPRTLTLKAKK